MFSPMIAVYCIVVAAFFSLFQALSLMIGEKSPQKTSLRRKKLADGLSPWLADILITQRIRDFDRDVITSGIRYSSGQVLTGMAALTIVAMLAADIGKLNSLLSVAIGCLVGIVLPVVIIRHMRRRRMAHLIQQLPEALDMLVRSLRVGHPVSIGIGMVGAEMPDPIGGEFKRVFDSMSLGLDLKDALEELGTRLQVLEVRYMVAGIRIQYATGGNLAEVLASLSSVMRERVRLKMKVKALTAETRFSGNVMAVLPFILVGGLLLIHPDFYKEVPGSPLLQEIMAGAGLLLIIGVVVMRRIVNIRA